MDLASPLAFMALNLVLALVVSAVGFTRVVYFVSIGYAFSIVAMSLVDPALLFAQMTWVSALHCGLMLLWGLRLGVFLVRRELRSSYRDYIQSTDESNARLSWVTQGGIWLGVSLLYALMFSPCLFVLLRGSSAADGASLTELVGLAVMGGGLLLETVADGQKSAFKAEHPDRFCDRGLYRWVRCPNYLGEIAFWVGSWIVGLGVYGPAWQWIASLTGLVLLVMIMLSSSRRLEITQGERYGERPEYQEYIRSVPILFPGVSLYSLRGLPYEFR